MRRFTLPVLFVVCMALESFTLFGCGGGGGSNNVGEGTAAPTVSNPTVAITAYPAEITQGSFSILTVTATNATQLTISDNTDDSIYTLAANGGTLTVTPAATTIYTATATGAGITSTAQTTITVAPQLTSTVVYLPVPNAAIGTIAITNCTNATPIVCTAPNHGLSNGAAVWIQGIAGNTNADGFFQIGSVTANTFTLANYLYFSNVPAGNGAFASNATVNGVGPSVTPLTAYATVAHPRLLLDGASGPLTASVSNTSTKANTNNPFYKALVTQVNNFSPTYATTGIDSYANGNGTGMARYADAAMLWAASGGTNSTALTIAKWGVDNFEQIVHDGNGYGFYCSGGFQCGRDDTDVLLHPMEASLAIFQAYSLIHSQLTPTEITNFANKVFNDNALYRNANSSLGGGFGGINGDPTTSCTPYPANSSWSSNDCGFLHMEKYEFDVMVINPGQEANFCCSAGSDYPGGNGVYEGIWPYDGNHSTANQRGLLAAALALADDDARARSALTQLVAFNLLWEHAHSLSAETGMTTNGSRYQQYIDSPYYPEMVTMLKQSLGYDLSGNIWVKNLLPQEIYGLLPDGGTGAGYGPATLDQWLDPTGVNSNSTVSEWALPTLGLTQLYPSGTFTPYAYWLLKNNPDFSTYNYQNFADAQIYQYISYDPTFPASNVTGLPTQFLFRDTDLSTCQTIFGSKVAAHNYNGGSPVTDTPGCYPNMAFQMAISKSDWTTSASQVWMSAAYANTTEDRSGGGQYGAYHIYRNGYLLGGSGSGSSPDLVTGSARAGCSACSTLASDEVIEIGGADNWQPQASSANVSANFTRWAGTDPSGDSQSRYTYALIDVTPTYVPAVSVTRANRHVLHFKKASTQDYIVSYDDVALGSGNLIQSWWDYFMTGVGGTNNVSANTSARTVTNTLAAGSGKLSSAFLPVAGANTMALISTGASGNTYNTYTCPSTNGTSCNNSATSGEWLAVHEPTTNTSASMPALTQPACSAIGGNCTAVQIADSTSPKVAVFARQGALLTAVSFTTNHAGTAQYAVAGLAAGSYNITNGSGSATCTVASGDNTCYFESNSGTVTISQGAIANVAAGATAMATQTVTVTGPATSTAPATMATPVAGSILPGSSVTFNWTGGTNVSQYQLQISTKSNTSGFSVAYTGTGTSATVSGLPINGKTVYVKLLSLNSSSTWLTQAYTYTASSACGTMSLGQGASLNGYIPFATGSLWRKDISASAIDSNSATLINSIGSSVGLHPDFGSGTYDGSLMGIPYIIVDTTQAMVNVSGASGGGEGDPSAMPIPANAPIEGYPNAGDNHVLVLQSGSCWLYELYQGMDSNGNWSASFGTVWDLLGNETRPYTWSSSDAAGLPIFEGLVRYDEVASGKINHAIRITLPTTRQAFVAPATHWASTNTSSSAAPMGMRIRLKANFDVSGYSATNQVILNAMKQYGVIVADNGSAMYISGAPDSRWNNDDLHLLNQITAADFDVVKMGTIYTPSNIPQGSAPTITNFATSSQGVAAGSPVTLSWNVSGASYVFISPTVGPVRGNSVTFTPTQTATYTIYATNQYGRTTATVTVDVQ